MASGFGQHIPPGITNALHHKVPAAHKQDHFPSVVVPPLGKVRFAPLDGTAIVECWLHGEATASAKTAYVAVARDGRQGVVEYPGSDPPRMTVPVLLDGWQAGSSVQSAWNALQHMATAADQDTPPTQILVTGGLPTPRGTWVIESLTPEAGSLLPDGVTLYRQIATVVLLDAAFGTVIRKPTTKGKAAAKKNSGHKATGGATKRTIIVGAHDTLQTIAVRYLHDAGRAHEIATLNGIRDGDHLKAGRHLRLPPP